MGPVSSSQLDTSCSKFHALLFGTYIRPECILLSFHVSKLWNMNSNTTTKQCYGSRESHSSCGAGDNPERPYLKSARMEGCTAVKSWHPDHTGIAAGDLAYGYIERLERHG